ncbi:hypothetical protein [Gemmata sp.]|uniref:hypothetical protein n=1 Tax=Gemmata sp. TaxID=1914242 RepID=UPI003F71A0CF
MKIPNGVRQIEINTRDGNKVTYLPVMDLARAWLLDYPALRSHLHRHDLTTRVEATGLVFRGAMTTLICIRREDLAGAHVLAQTTPPPSPRRSPDSK